MARVTIHKLDGKVEEKEYNPQKGSGILAVLKDLYGVGDLLQGRVSITPEEHVAAGDYKYQVTAQAIQAPVLAERTDNQILEEIRQELDGYKRFLKPVKAWANAVAWVLSFCVLLANMHRDHQKDDMKTLKDHVDKLKRVQSRLQQLQQMYPDAQALAVEIDVVVKELESWYQAAEQWFRMH